MIFPFGVRLLKDKWRSDMWKLILPYSIVQPILLRFRHETIKRVNEEGKGLINRYVLYLPIPSPDESNSLLVREEKSRKKRLCTVDSLNGTLRFLLCDVTLSPEEATAASSQDPNILYRRMAYLEANALGQESWWYEGFKPTR